MKVFLTGGTGFIGSYVLRFLLERGVRVSALRFAGTEPHLSTDLGELDWIDGTMEDDFETILTGCDAVIHLAAYGVNPAQNSWKEAIYWNVVCLERMLEASKAAGVKRFVLAGSCFEYGLSGEQYEKIPVDAPLLPNKAYDASKAAATILAQAFARQNDLELAILRPFQVFGVGEAPNRLWPSLKKAAEEGRDFEMTLGEQLRDFVPVESVAQSFVAHALDQQIEGGCPVIKNLGTGVATSIADFARHWWSECQATGALKMGALPYRDNEVMRFVPEV
ncbi:NAD-dependent epimerase/dehydratase family protein [Akkermansiaceae bacterium]|nr:NAD-dependent epimerase/dehydratase family protein [Akkermansiaceae bacterium]